MRKVAVSLCVFFSFTIAGYSQIAMKTVTNSELEKYSSQRIAADKEYRRTYAEKGQPSPEEIRAQNEARIQETLDYADQLRSENLERERLAVEAMKIQAAMQPVVVNQSSPNYSPDYGYSGYGYSGYGYPGYGVGTGYWGYGYNPYVYNPYGTRYRNGYYGRGRYYNNQRYYSSGGVIWPVSPMTGGLGFPSMGRPR